MRCHDLEVFHLSLAVRSFVLDTHIREMHVPINDRKVPAGRPFGDLGCVALCVLLLLTPVTSLVPQEMLIVPLQFVVEDHAGDDHSLVLEAFGGSLVRSIEMGVV